MQRQGDHSLQAGPFALGPGPVELGHPGGAERQGQLLPDLRRRRRGSMEWHEIERGVDVVHRGELAVLHLNGELEPIPRQPAHPGEGESTLFGAKPAGLGGQPGRRRRPCARLIELAQGSVEVIEPHQSLPSFLALRDIVYDADQFAALFDLAPTTADFDRQEGPIGPAQDGFQNETFRGRGIGKKTDEPFIAGEPQQLWPIPTDHFRGRAGEQIRRAFVDLSDTPIGSHHHDAITGLLHDPSEPGGRLIAFELGPRLPFQQQVLVFQPGDSTQPATDENEDRPHRW
jgi:hypothetical protein